jgi:hypothetical protein
LSVTCDRSVVFFGSSTNKTDRHNITEISLKVALNSTKQTNKQYHINKHDVSIFHWIIDKSNTAGSTSEAGLTFWSTRVLPPFLWVIFKIVQSLVFYVVICKSLFVFFPLFIWPLYCLPVLDLWLLITAWYLQTLFF